MTMKFKTFITIMIITILCCALVGIGFGIRNFAVNIANADEVVETTVTEETDTDILDKLKVITAEIKEQRAYKWLVCGLSAIIGGLGIGLATVYGKLKSFKAGYKVSKKTKDTLEDILKNFDKESILNAVVKVVGEEMKELTDKVLSQAEVKNGEIAKIIGEMGVTQAQIDKIIEAMKLAWGGKVDGLNEVLAEIPEKSAYDKVVLENKLLKDELSALKKAEAEETVAEIEETAKEELK